MIHWTVFASLFSFYPSVIEQVAELFVFIHRSECTRTIAAGLQTIEIEPHSKIEIAVEPPKVLVELRIAPMR